MLISYSYILKGKERMKSHYTHLVILDCTCSVGVILESSVILMLEVIPWFGRNGRA
jgi:hypothetical protein